MRSAKILGTLALLLACVSTQAWGQTANTGTVLGTVTDQTGAVVAGAKLELINTATNDSRTLNTNTAGQYVFPNLAPGIYKITVTMQGFRTVVVSNVKVDVAKSSTVDVPLEVGTLTQVVEVSTTARSELQTTDAQIGQTLTTDEAMRYPSLRRNAAGLLGAQPGVTVGTGVFPRVGVRVAGAVDDQNNFTLDGIDVTDNVVGGGNLDTVVPLRVESIDELRVGVSNPNATFGRSSGGQVAVVGKRGTNSFHGATYWYHQNDNLNANTWENNRLKIPRAELKDNRFGGKVGGPIWKDRSFFFFNYEGRRFPQVSNILRLVPSDDLKRGILKFRDATGNVVSYNLATSTACVGGPTQSCDPRSIGISPTIKALWALMPPGNDPSNGDGLNTIGFRGTASTPFRDDFWVLRLDHEITKKWRFNGSYTYYRILQTETIAQSNRGQVDIRNGQVKAVAQTPTWRDAAIAGVDGEISPHLLNSFRFGWVRQRNFFNRLAPSAAAALLNLPGTSTAAGPIALAPGLAQPLNADLVDAPIDVDTQRARFQATLSKNVQFVDNLSWIKGTHTMQFGTNIRRLPTIHVRNDKVVGSLASLEVLMDADVSPFLTSISAENRPPACSGTVTINCLTSAGDNKVWDRLYAAALGLVDNVGILTTRDGSLNPLPFGTPLINDSTLTAYEFYAQDTWRIRPTLTMTYGLSYGWQTPPSEALGRQTLVIDAGTGNIVTAPAFLEAKRQAALQGKTFAPNFGFLPVGAAKRDVFGIDWGNVGPRAALAWNPSVKEGFFHRVIGEGKTVLRGGFSLIYDRTNTVQSVIIPMLGVGFAQTINVGRPKCDVSGAPGPGCNASSTNTGASIYRVGVDGSIPVPTVPAVSSPVVPGRSGELFSFQVDPDTKIGRSYSVDLTVQRELPFNMILEVGWAGRWSRRLPQGVNINASPYFFKDSASGQTFAEAYDAVAQALINKQPVATQPWFENQLPGYASLSDCTGKGGTSTACVAANFPTLFAGGLVSSLFSAMNGLRVDKLARPGGLPPFNSLQLFDLHMRTYIGTSNYQGLLISLRKRTSHGLSLNVNYTFSKTLDDNISNQNQAGIYSNSFVTSVDRGPSIFDRTHIFNAGFLYDLPFGKGHRLGASNWLNKVVGGWYISGIVTAFSGLPQIVVESSQVWGGGAVFGFQTGAIPTVNPSTFGNDVNHGVAGSHGIGTNGDPARNGSGLNLFGNPEQVFNSFRNVQISKDGRTGRANPVRGLPFKNLDMSIGKKTSIGERLAISYSFDFFNIFNHVNFVDPSLDQSFPARFGVITQQLVPANREISGARWIQFGLRVEF